jgi:hypothetical protein
MPYKTFTRPTIAIVFLMLLSTGVAFGSDSPLATNTGLPTYYPASFQNTGVLNSLGSNTAIVSGLRYIISPNVLIHSLSTEFSSRYALREDKDIGFSHSSDANNKRTITEIWLLPPGSAQRL